MGASASRVCGSWGKPYPENQEKAKFVIDPIDSEQFLKDIEDPDASKLGGSQSASEAESRTEESQSKPETEGDPERSASATDAGPELDVKRVKGTKKLPQTSEEWEALKEKDFATAGSRANLLAHVIKKLQKNDPQMTDIKLYGYEKDKLKPLAKALERNTSLKGLSCHKCNIDVETAKEFADMLRINKSLAWLDLSENDLGDAGTRALAIDALERNTTLVTLLLDSNKITAFGAKALADVLLVNRTLRRLSLSKNEIKNGAEHFVAVVKRNHLWQLRLSFNDIPPEVVVRFRDAVKVATNLEDLNLHREALPVAQLRGPPPWHHLKLPDREDYENTLEELEWTEKLDLKFKKFCSADYAIIAALIPYNRILKTLDLYKSPPVDGRAGIFALARVLREYPKNFDNPPITNSIIDSIRVGEGTMWIPLSAFREGGGDGILMLAQKPKPGSPVGDDIDPWGALFIAALLKHNTHVTALQLTGNLVHREGLTFARTLLTNTKLTELDLSNTRLSQESIDAIIYVLRTLSPQADDGTPMCHVHLLHNSSDYRTLRKVEATSEHSREKPERNPIAWYIPFSVLLYPLILPIWVFSALVRYFTQTIPTAQIISFGLKQVEPKKYKSVNAQKGNLSRGYYLRMLTSLDLTGSSPAYIFFLAVFAYFIIWWPWVLAFTVLPSSTPEPPAIGGLMANYCVLVILTLTLWWCARGDREQSRIAFPSRRSFPRLTLLNCLVLLSLIGDLIQFSTLPLLDSVYPVNTKMNDWNYAVFAIPFKSWTSASGIFWGAFCVVVIFLTFCAFFHLCAWQDLQLFLHYQPVAEVIMYLFGNVFYFSTIIALIRFTDCSYHELTHNSTLDIFPSNFCWNEDHAPYVAGAMFLLTYYVLGVNFFGSLFFDNLSPTLDLQWSNGQQIFDRSLKLVYALLLIYCKKNNNLQQLGVGLGILVLFSLGAAVYRHPPTSPFMRSAKVYIYASGLWTCVITLSGTFMSDPQGQNWTLVPVVLGWGFLLIVFILSLFLPTTEGRLYAQNAKAYHELIESREKAFQEKLTRQNSTEPGLERQKSQGPRFQIPSLPPVSPTLAKNRSQEPFNGNGIDETDPPRSQENSSHGDSDERNPTVIHSTNGGSQPTPPSQGDDDDDDTLLSGDQGTTGGVRGHEVIAEEPVAEEEGFDEKHGGDQDDDESPLQQQTPPRQNSARRDLGVQLSRIDSKSSNSSGAAVAPTSTRSPRSALATAGRKPTNKRVNFQEDA